MSNNLDMYTRGKELFDRFLPLSNRLRLLQGIVQNPQQNNKDTLPEGNKLAREISEEFAQLVEDVNIYIENKSGV